MTHSQAFEAMKYFLEKYYENTHSDDLGSLLGDLSLLQDGMPADGAIWLEWLESIKKMGAFQKDILNIHEATEVMKRFLKEYADRIESKDILQLLSNMQRLKDGTTVKPIYCKGWLEAVQKASSRNGEKLS